MRAITVGYGQVKGKAKEYPYLQPILYEVKARRDGVLTWRHVKHFGTPRRSNKLATRDAQLLAEQMGVSFLPKIRHGTIYSSP